MTGPVMATRGGAWWRGSVVAVGLLAALTASEARAGSCDKLVAPATTAKGAALVTAWKKLADCDPSVAGREYERFMVASGDLQTLTDLTLAAVDGDAWNAVWQGMGRVPYEHRTELAKAVGATCDARVKVLPFLEGAYTALKGADFESWQPAFEACRAAPLDAFLERVIADPPASPYNEKYHGAMRAFADHKGADAVPTLEAAAILAGTRGGPFSSVLDVIKEAIQPSGRLSDADRAAYEASLTRVALAVPVASARLVADKLLNAGSEAAAASLLAARYADRMEGGALRWVAAAVEACDGDAVVHWVTWTEAPTRWEVQQGATEALRAVPAKLKCKTDGAWPVVSSDEPLRAAADADAWLTQAEQPWVAKGVKVKRKQEKVAVP